MSKADLDLKKLPRHIAVIMDGNGRWAEKHGLTRAEGHEAGVKSVRAIVEGCRDLGGIRSLSLYAFSTENWRRSEAEVTALFRLLTRYIKQEIGNLHKEGIRVVFMGRSAGLADELLSDMGGAMRKTGENDEMILNLGINYGSRAEMVDACQAIAREVAEGKLRAENIDEACIGQHLYVPEIQDVDLLIRTSGEMRISNFMNWQLAYSEIVVTNTLWPDFRKRHLYECIRTFQSRRRRFGGRR